jgi:hypothetical protein
MRMIWTTRCCTLLGRVEQAAGPEMIGLLEHQIERMLPRLTTATTRPSVRWRATRCSCNKDSIK